MSGDGEDELARLRARLAEAEQTIAELARREVDTVASDGDAPVSVDAAQEALRESERRFAAVFEGASDAMVIFDDAGRCLDANPAACRLLALPREQILERSVFAFVTDAPAAEATVEALIGVERAEGVTLALTTDGVTRRVEYRAVANVLPGVHLVAFRDVEAAWTAQTVLARLAAIVESSGDAIVGTSRDGVIEDWNTAAERLYGYPAEEALGRPVALLDPPDRAGEAARLIARATTGEHIAELETVRRRRDGSDVEVALAVSPIRDGAGRVIGCSTIARDISERKRAERRFRAVLESAPDALVAVDGEGRMVFVNGRLAEVFGYRQDELLGQSVHLLVPEALRAEHEAHRLRYGAASPRRMTAREVRARKKDGTEFAAEVTLSPVGHDADDVMVIASIRDVTELNVLREQLMLSDRMVTIGTLAAGVAHEINNPLAAVTANLDLALQELNEVARGRGSVDELRGELGDARDAANRVRQIVRDLKIFSHVDTEQRYAVDVRQVMESSLRMAFNEIRHRARLVKDYGFVPRVYASESRLGQVFLNLLVNAAQAIPEGHADDNEIRVTTALGEPGFVVVSISDTGEGMSREVLNRLFTPFYTTKPVGVGTGLGLSICHRLVTGFGGTIAVDSAVGRGTALRIALPIAEESEVTRELPVAAPAAPRRGRVLVVDDEVVIGHAVKRALSREHDVTALSSATEALERLRAGERFDVILCDLMMPQMTGMELHAAVVELDPEQAARMIFLTGGAFTPLARAFLDQTSNLRVEKPFDVQHLRTLVSDRVR